MTKDDIQLEMHWEMEPEETINGQNSLSTVQERVYSPANTSFARAFIIISTTISRCLWKK